MRTSAVLARALVLVAALGMFGGAYLAISDAQPQTVWTHPDPVDHGIYCRAMAEADIILAPTPDARHLARVRKLRCAPTPAPVVRRAHWDRGQLALGLGAFGAGAALLMFWSLTGRKEAAA